MDLFLNKDDYRDKVLGCWLGKNVGGTIGAPFEWKRQVNNITFYTQDLHGEPMPNDDLDIQLLWLVALEEMGLDVDSRRLADYFCLYVTPHWAEYGIAKTNMRAGLLPPLSGSHRNPFRHSNGSFIRSEIWACIAPGLPAVAAEYAYEDAILDHGGGEGVYAEVFMATLESAAFLVKDLGELIKIGLSYIPADCGVAAAVETALGSHHMTLSWRETRDEILRRHRGAVAYGAISDADRKAGFGDGVQGYDAPSNVAFTIAALLYGGDDFGKVQCTAVNFGEDTDCTAATAGSVWGIIHGAKAIPRRWIEPIGRGIKTVTLNLGELGYFGDQLPQTVDALTDRTARIAAKLLARHDALHLMADAPTKIPAAVKGDLRAHDNDASLYEFMNGPRFDFDFFTIYTDYDDGPTIRQGEGKKVKVSIRNRYKTPANLSLHWYVPEGWRVTPAADGWALCQATFIEASLDFEFTLHADRFTSPVNRATLEVTAEGRPTVMLVPVTLLSDVSAQSPLPRH